MITAIRQLKDWSFTQIGGGEGTKDGEWLQASQFPTTVHVELLKHKKIPDPFIGLHEWDVQWIGESLWSFKTVFEVTTDELKAPNADLVFDGLDTFASVSLDKSSTDNQFAAYRASVKSHLKSAFCKGRGIEKQHEKLNLWNGDSSRLHVRKAQYNYGWDWGPTLMTVGPWKPIYLHTYHSRITDLDVRTRVSESLSVDLSASFTLSEKIPGFASFVLRSSDGSIPVSIDKIPMNAGQGTVSFQFEPGKVQLWYPVRYGKQALYTAEVEITDSSGHTLDQRTQRIAFRRVSVVQDPLADQEGRTFLFEINNIRIFCGGNMTPERYKAWLQLLVDGNQNMIRVWGGGIYEHDSFYDTCDVLVWQDFMFGCGQYPAYDSFLESVNEEAVQNVKRLRHHPSIVIFDYQIAESLNLELDYSDEKSDFRKTNFPARHLYERVLPSIVQQYSDIYYHRSSPYSGFGKDTRDQKYGDLHQCMLPWRSVPYFSNYPRSEGYPDLRTVDYWLGGDTSQRYPQSRVNSNHNKAAGFERRLELYLVENFKHSFEMESYAYYTQVMQSETLAAAYRLWRRNWRGKGREYTAGALVWQLNDCWPTTSWAIVDYFLRPKPAYFAVARELRSYTVGVTRKEKETYPDYRSAANFTIETILEIWGTNSTLFEKKATLDVTSFDLHSEWTNHWSKQIVLAPNSSTELFQGEVPGVRTRKKWSEVPRVIIVSARLLDEEGEVLGRYSNWPEPFKFIDFPAFEDVSLKAEVAQDGESVTLSTKKPVKGIVLNVEGEDVKFSDQAIDLVPGDPQVVHAVGLKGRAVKTRFLGDGSA
ncbi:glycoside hydrolase family 2 protein [Armillaria luteobubalina]|uniref:Beta-mannosidase B n=1 Tax=Armillaria luteobubalina TaxID=153913 RepID=A0AA39PD90_9AGAR|nr:glycoside hydrolase family 2 protein [Armillaria luteobubalina]